VALEARIEELRNFERDYRIKLKSYIEGQLRELDSDNLVSQQAAPQQQSTAAQQTVPPQQQPAPVQQAAPQQQPAPAGFDAPAFGAPAFGAPPAPQGYPGFGPQ
jgi:hypothetical protein